MALIVTKAAQRRKPPFLPDEILEKLKCNECKEYLSTPPILKHLDGRSICGECSNDISGPLIRNTEYETIASFVEFPCKNQNCHMRIKFGKYSIHETDCLFRQYYCPSCSWQGCAPELGAHFAVKHQEYYLDGISFYPEIRKNCTREMLYLTEGNMFVVQTKCIVLQCRFWCLVRYIGKPQTSGFFKFNLEFRGNRKKNSYLTEEEIVQSDLCWVMDTSCALEVNITTLLKELYCPLELKCRIHIKRLSLNK